MTALPTVHFGKSDSDKQTYFAPRLIAYGHVQDLTQSGSGNPNESQAQPTGCKPDALAKPCNPSDIRLKDVLFATGKHICGVQTYLFSYKSEHASRCGEGAFVGVMAQDLLSVRPDAVVLSDDGFYAVDYALLGGKLTH